MSIINQSVLRDINTGLIMRMIRENSPISRTDLSEKSGLAPSTVTIITSELQDRKYIRECGRASSTGGRRQILLEINPDGGYFLGVELNFPTSHIGVLDLSGTLVRATSYRTASEGSESVFHQLVEHIQTELDWCGEGPNPVLGIGVGMTGIIDSVAGTVIQSTALGWTDFPLIPRLQSLFDHPITLENEANAAAFGEYFQGVQQTSAKNMMYVIVGAGIGCGIIINGSLHTGSHGMAGEIGHITVDTAGPPCRCGKHGCLEVMASGSTLYDRYRANGGGASISTFLDLADLAESGDVVAQNVLSESGRMIGTAIGNQVNVLDLDSVILGGELLDVESILFTEIYRAVFESVLPMARDSLAVHFSCLKKHSVLIGAATLHWKQIFS